MGWFENAASAASAASAYRINESSNAEKELTRKITEAEIEIENFSLEPDENFSNNTINKIKD